MRKQVAFRLLLLPQSVLTRHRQSDKGVKARNNSNLTLRAARLLSFHEFLLYGRARACQFAVLLRIARQSFMARQSFSFTETFCNSGNRRRSS